uniref:Uncharacterized protein n=1 Tax=Panagrolaimus sp. PS1159 TaxID=55785 RepID=A0AC35FDE0_9BILA
MRFDRRTKGRRRDEESVADESTPLMETRSTIEDDAYLIPHPSRASLNSYSSCSTML